MRSAQLFIALAVLATSVSSASIGLLPPDHIAHRRHAAAEVHNSVLQARGARRINPEVPGLSLRTDTAPRRYRKRGLNQRRCAAKTTTSTAAAEPTTEAAPTSTPEPEPTTSSAEPTQTKVKTTQTTTKATKTSTSAKPTATSDNDDSSSSGGSFTGQATFYAPGLGSCGDTNSDTDLICAVSQSLYDGFEGFTGSDPNSNPICGRKIKATYEGKSVTVTVVDRCVGCALHDLDFSPSAFDKLADQSLGRLSGMTWSFV